MCGQHFRTVCGEPLDSPAGRGGLVKPHGVKGPGAGRVGYAWFMAVVLRGPAGDFVLNNRGWALVLKLGYDFGWRPRGTEAPANWQAVPAEPWAGKKWNGADYFSCRGQLVSALDAASLGEALGGAMDDLPNHDPLQGEAGRALNNAGFPGFRALESERALNAFEVFGGVNKPRFRELVAYCRAGEFAIW
jgi:hypothetical protein